MNEFFTPVTVNVDLFDFCFDFLIRFEYMIDWPGNMISAEAEKSHEQ